MICQGVDGPQQGATGLVNIVKNQPAAGQPSPQTGTGLPAPIGGEAAEDVHILKRVSNLDPRDGPAAPRGLCDGQGRFSRPGRTDEKDVPRSIEHSSQIFHFSDSLYRTHAAGTPRSVHSLFAFVTDAVTVGGGGVLNDDLVT